MQVPSHRLSTSVNNTVAYTMFRQGMTFGLLLAATSLAWQHSFAPFTWATTSMACWIAFLVNQGGARLTNWDRWQVLWGLSSGVAFLNFAVGDQNFVVSSAALPVK